MSFILNPISTGDTAIAMEPARDAEQMGPVASSALRDEHFRGSDRLVGTASEGYHDESDGVCGSSGEGAAASGSETIVSDSEVVTTDFETIAPDSDNVPSAEVQSIEGSGPVQISGDLVVRQYDGWTPINAQGPRLSAPLDNDDSPEGVSLRRARPRRQSYNHITPSPFSPSSPLRSRESESEPDAYGEGAPDLTSRPLSEAELERLQVLLRTAPCPSETSSTQARASSSSPVLLIITPPSSLVQPDDTPPIPQAWRRPDPVQEAISSGQAPPSPDQEPQSTTQGLLRNSQEPVVLPPHQPTSPTRTEVFNYAVNRMLVRHARDSETLPQNLIDAFEEFRNIQHNLNSTQDDIEDARHHYFKLEDKFLATVRRDVTAVEAAEHEVRYGHRYNPNPEKPCCDGNGEQKKSKKIHKARAEREKKNKNTQQWQARPKRKGTSQDEEGKLVQPAKRTKKANAQERQLDQDDETVYEDESESESESGIENGPEVPKTKGKVPSGSKGEGNARLSQDKTQTPAKQTEKADAQEQQPDQDDEIGDETG
ncbi:hypothetical protein B0J11DRAFT_581027 [Dendryphion nanum]|uniref:Uncharacterized protein n=1 Tax=Dendryphion nanum TaxID=256645 RepID=A0A9P9IJA3_9PLEO|nr:hypothetical protein B0J11DRAFT_581027 [Dendryphion nanum]